MAHTLALDLGLPTIAVIGTGLNVSYPFQNQKLKERIIENGGLVISEFEMDAPPQRFHFIQRNRLIAYWSKAVWVVEAERKSGTLNTAKWARDYHRDLYATPSFPGEIKNIGAQELIDTHHAQPFWGAHSLIESWLALQPLKNIRPAALNTRYKYETMVP